VSSDLPLWVTVPGTLLLVTGGLATLIGSLGLLRLRDFYARMHGPSMGTTIGTATVLLASLLVSSAASERPVVHELLVTILVLTSAPVSSMMLVQAALYRAVHRRK
jgi:multicomponent K+:H+ antiporter subunit G